jgi:hypothetical protein
MVTTVETVFQFPSVNRVKSAIANRDVSAKHRLPLDYSREQGSRNMPKQPENFYPF